MEVNKMMTSIWMMTLAMVVVLMQIWFLQGMKKYLLKSK